MYKFQTPVHLNLCNTLYIHGLGEVSKGRENGLCVSSATICITRQITSYLSSRKGNLFLGVLGTAKWYTILLEFRLISPGQTVQTSRELDRVKSFLYKRYFPFQIYQLEMKRSNNHPSSLSNSLGYNTDRSPTPPSATTWDSPERSQCSHGQTPSSYDRCLGLAPLPQTLAALPTSSSHRASLSLLLEVSAALVERSTEDAPRELREVPNTPTVKRKRGLDDDEQVMYVKYHHSFLPTNS